MLTVFNSNNEKKCYLVKDMSHRRLYRLIDNNSHLTNCIGVCIHNYFIVLHNPQKIGNYNIIHDTSTLQFVELEPKESLVLTQE